MYGVSIASDSGRYLIGDAAQALVFIGKAAFSSASYSSDAPSIGKRRIFWRSGGNNQTSESTYTPSPSTGVAQYELVSNCDQPTRTTTWPIPDETAIAAYTISAPFRPIAFIAGNSLRRATVVSIKNAGGVVGSYSWEIKVLASYPTGDRAQVPLLELYCFCPQPNEALTGSGFATYLSDGAVAYASSRKLLNVRDTAIITGVSASGTAISSTHEFANGLAPQISKPAFMAADWLRVNCGYKTDRYFFGAGVTLDGSCLGERYHAYCDQTLVGAGFYISGGALTVVIVGTQVSAIGSLTTLPSYVGYQYTLTFSATLPFSIPIIDCTDYD